MISATFLVAAVLGGPFDLGHVSVSWTDPARADRVVTAEVWYPARTAGESVPFAAPPEGGFPVLAFGHGYLMQAARYRYLWESLVPRGYVMALATTGGELFPDHEDFALDLAFLIRRLEAEGATAGSLFEGAIAERSAAMGHSMGGGASVLAASLDPTIDAVVNLAAANTNPSAIEAAALVEQPSLMLAGSDDCVTPVGRHQGPIHAALASDCKLLVVLDGASHCQFAEQDFLCGLGETNCSASMSRATQHERTLELVGSWLDAVLGGSGSAWADHQAAHAGDDVLTVDGSCVLGPLSYCDAPPSSTGEPARASIEGSTSVSAADLVLVAAPIPANRFGLFFYGAAQAEVPFGNGVRCVAGGGLGLQRLAVRFSGPDGVLVHPLDYDAPPTPSGAILPGSLWNFQCWFRDPLAGGANFSLSDALLLSFVP